MIWTILWISCLGILSVHAEPAILFKRWLGFREEDICGVYKFHDFITKLLYCTMCSSFWIALIITWSLPMACVISIVANIIDKRLL